MNKKIYTEIYRLCTITDKRFLGIHISIIQIKYPHYVLGDFLEVVVEQHLGNTSI